MSGCICIGRWSVHQYGDDDSFLLAVLCRRMETVVRSKVIEAVAKLGKRERQALLKKKGLEIQDA